MVWCHLYFQVWQILTQKVIMSGCIFGRCLHKSNQLYFNLICLTGPLIAEDRILQSMPNVVLALHLLCEMYNSNSLWKPYLSILSLCGLDDHLTERDLWILINKKRKCLCNGCVRVIETSCGNPTSACLLNLFVKTLIW